MRTQNAESYLQAAASVVDLVGRIGPDAWDGPGLGDWDLRSLVGHTGRALTTVLTYLHQPAERIDQASPETYFAHVLPSGRQVDPGAVLERGRQAGRALGDDPAAGFGALVDQVGAELASADPAAVITTIAGGMTVDAYLPTRTFELVVHGLDIGAAADLPTTFTPASLNETCALAGRIAARAGRGPQMLRALTGRADLPPGFSIVA
ncbi:maleylpyruvate isomerase N-terminal domain-containing protein [Allobranchiibius sp. GilTou73]|uniref:maleylpyruvate isomerase N-terminal domain-containing protein n=1 Tax=Allobranchiibius sp. GilTou73 TaxID=2904523 RepID=UPI001F1B63A4|nr:maleylpyruvate isomerase N-terminal domain-containing protein [Allobranchiibius sp. GilTou73]UIJ35689.1 maleylpyruvate isomerase N-terminal domain-containing protein [Allobranchiibius sp. GilTou73]